MSIRFVFVSAELFIRRPILFLIFLLYGPYFTGPLTYRDSDENKNLLLPPWNMDTGAYSLTRGDELANLYQNEIHYAPCAKGDPNNWVDSGFSERRQCPFKMPLRTEEGSSNVKNEVLSEFTKEIARLAAWQCIVEFQWATSAVDSLLGK